MNHRTRLLLPAIAGFFLAVLLMSAGTIRRATAPEMVPAPMQSSAGITAYPNPFTDVLNVQVVNAMNKPMVIRMRSVSTGAILLEYTVTYTGPVAVNTSSLPAGGYVVSASSPNGYLLGRREVRKSN